MLTNYLRLTSLLVFVFTAQTAVAGQFVIELNAPLDPPSAALLSRHDITLDETLSADADSYAVFSAASETALIKFLKVVNIDPEKISEVLFVNSPTIGGGQSAGSEPRDGHNVYVIERPIPGVGFFGLEKKQKISMSSNAAIAKLGDIVEWDHSYLTNEGTYCVYRADSPATLREHGALAGAPIGKITSVVQKNH
jgi:hypothetical protein